MLDRLIVPPRLSLMHRQGRTLGYNPELNTWEAMSEDTAELLRWLRAGRDRSQLFAHLARRFDYDDGRTLERLREIIKWCLANRMLYLDRAPDLPAFRYPDNPLASVYWIATQACNLRCTYCYQDATVARPGELSTDEGKALIDQAVEVDARVFVFTGGEPFVRRDLLELARYARGRGLYSSVITNGHYITPKTIREVAEAFQYVTISLDHMIPEHHDKTRGEGSWKRAARAVELVLEAGIKLDVNSVLSRLGLQDVEELLRLSRTWRVGKHRIVPQFPMGRGDAVREDEIMPDELIGLADRLHEAGQKVGKGETLAAEPEGKNSTKRVRREHCGSGLTEVSVDPEGWVYPCRLLQYPEQRAGNVRDRRLKDIVAEHPALVAARARTAHQMEPCKTCIIRNNCGGGCRGIHASFTSDPARSSPLFCAFLRGNFEVMAWASAGEVPPPRKTHFHGQLGATDTFVPASSLVRRSS